MQKDTRGCQVANFARRMAPLYEKQGEKTMKKRWIMYLVARMIVCTLLSTLFIGVNSVWAEASFSINSEEDVYNSLLMSFSEDEVRELKEAQVFQWRDAEFVLVDAEDLTIKCTGMWMIHADNIPGDIGDILERDNTLLYLNFVVENRTRRRLFIDWGEYHRTWSEAASRLNGKQAFVVGLGDLIPAQSSDFTTYICFSDTGFSDDEEEFFMVEDINDVEEIVLGPLRVFDYDRMELIYYSEPIKVKLK